MACEYQKTNDSMKHGIDHVFVLHLHPPPFLFFFSKLPNPIIHPSSARVNFTHGEMFPHSFLRSLPSINTTAIELSPVRR